MKPALPAPYAFNASVILPLLPVLLLGAAALTGGKKTLVAEAARRAATAKFAAQEAAPKGLPYGALGVERTPDILLKDLARGKDIPVTVTAPDTPGPFPLIVFSHGAGGDGTQNEPLLRWWASHGYVVISPTHSDSIRWQQSDLCGGENLETEETDRELQSVVRLASHDPQAGVQRVRDISFVLNSLNTLEEKVPSLAGKIDRAHIGVAGTSLGAYTAKLIGGAAFFVPSAAKSLSFRDPRVRAILQFSGQETGYQGMTRESGKSLRLPVMTVTGAEDRGQDALSPERVREPFVFSPATGSSYQIVIAGGHQGEGSSSAPAPANQRAVFSYVEQTTLDFWDMALKNDTNAKALLENKAASLALKRGITATIEHK